MEKINIALPSDENYVCGLTATAGSIAMHASRDAVLSFHILDGGIKDATFAEFEKVVRKWHPHCEFIRHPINEDLFKAFPSWSGNRMTYARMMIPKLMPDEEFCIYCDTDILWLTDIAPLWAKRDASIVFQSSSETYDETLCAEQAWFKKNGLPFDSGKYVCGGLSIYNIQMMHNERVIQQVGEFITSHPDIRMADQTAMNALLFGRIGLLDTSWQRLTVSRQKNEPVVGKALHYAGEIPWKRPLWNSMLTDTIILWHRINGKLHGKSAWWSMRQYFGMREIIYRRVLWYTVASRLLSSVFYGILKLTGRGSLTMTFEKWNHPIKGLCNI